MATFEMSEIRKLSVAQGLELVEAIWDSIAEDASPDNLPLTEAQREELDRRLADAEANPGQGESWEELKTRLLGTA